MLQKIAHWYISRAAVPFWFVFLTDSVIVVVAGLLAAVLCSSLSIVVGELIALLQSLALALPVYMVMFKLFHTYSGIIRKTTVGDLARVGCAMLLGVAVIMCLRLFGGLDPYLAPLRLRVLLLQAMLAVVMMSCVRITAKIFYDIYLRHTVGVGPYGYSDRDLIHMEMSHLLHRDPIRIDMRTVVPAMTGRCIMVTGAAGSIGSELVRLLANFKPSCLVLIDQAETPLHAVRCEMERVNPSINCVTIVTSICHSHRMRSIFEEYRPSVVFHAAAYKHVPMMEDNPVESILNNVDGTKKIADLAVEFGVEKFVMISTDKAVNPTNVMGCSKRLCEIYCQSLSAANPSTQFITTRFGNVLGSNGSVIPIFREQIRRGGPVQVTHPRVTRYFMLIPEACSLVLEAAVIGHGGEIFAFDMGEPVRIVDLAHRMIQLSGRLNIPIKFTGLRPGEKLYEEVLNEAEKVLPTRHPKINIAKVNAGDYEINNRLICSLIDTARRYDTIGTVRLMKQIVPEYRSPADSPYAALDSRATAQAPQINDPLLHLHPVAMREIAE